MGFKSLQDRPGDITVRKMAESGRHWHTTGTNCLQRAAPTRSKSVLCVKSRSTALGRQQLGSCVANSRIVQFGIRSLVFASCALTSDSSVEARMFVPTSRESHQTPAPQKHTRAADSYEPAALGKGNQRSAVSSHAAERKREHNFQSR